MNANKHVNDVSQDDLPLSVIERLVTYDEAKAKGDCQTVALPANDADSSDLECVDLLHRVWPDLGPSALHDELSPKILGDFRLLRELGRGGMGSVFEAEQLSMGRRVALKVLPFAALAHDKSLQRFRNEVRAAAALDHPNIVSVYSIGEDRGVHFYAMQLVRGQSLADLIGEMRRDLKSVTAAGLAVSTHVTAEEKKAGTKAVVPDQALISTAVDSRRNADSYRVAARLGIQAAEALHHAHDQGVLHRDIKPSNLMLDREGKLYVTDFGLARIEADAGMTTTGDIVGTLRYMAPEQALGKRVVIDHRADIYSLGATLYELLTLQLAFAETDRAELLKQIAFEEPRPLRKIDRYIPIELETIVLKAMAKNPEERYQTAGHLADDLRAYLDDKPIQAKRPTLAGRVKKWSRRNRSIVRGTAAVIMASSLAVACSIGWIARDRAARRTTAEISGYLAVAEAKRFVEEGEWEKGLQAIQQAEEVLDSADWRNTLHGATVKLHGEIDLAMQRDWRRLGDSAARRGEWLRAANFSRLNQKVGDRSPSEVEFDLLRYAAILVRQGDFQSYEVWQQHIAKDFADAEEPVRVERALRACLLMPWNGDFPKAIEKWQDILVRFQHGGSLKNGGWKVPWGCLALGLLEYRRGNWDKCVDWCTRGLSAPEPEAPRDAMLRLLLAMSKEQLGHREFAQRELRHAAEVIDGARPGGMWPSAQSSRWFNWEFAAILFDEATDVVGPGQ